MTALLLAALAKIRHCKVKLVSDIVAGTVKLVCR